MQLQTGRTAMKIVTIMGSPHKNGNTATVLGKFEEKISSKHEVERVNMADVEVMGCVGCMACRDTPEAPGCIQRDDANGIFEKLIEADVVIYATPLYVWGFSSQLKAFLDRHVCLGTGSYGSDWSSLVAGKPAMLLVTSGGPEENNADIIQTSFDRICSYLKMDCGGKFIVGLCTTPDELGDRAEETASRMAEALTSG
jgi:multimeric flavodoxin WrbA